MITRCTKRCKAAQHDTDNVSSEEDSFLRNPPRNPPRNVLAALDERISQLEQGNRSRRKRKTSIIQNTCSSQRPSSVPSKTVSFSPYIQNRGAQEFKRNNTAWKGKCSRWEMRGLRPTTTSSSPCRTKLPMNSRDCVHTVDSSESITSDHDSGGRYADDVCSSPGPARFGASRSRCRANYKNCSCCCSAEPCYSAESHPAVASILYNSGSDYQCYHPGRAWHVPGPSYTSTNTRDNCFRFSGKTRHFRSDACNGGMTVDLLLAKYGDYSYTKTISPLTSYFPYKSTFLSAGRPVGDTSSNKLPYTMIPSSSFAPSRKQWHVSNSSVISPVPFRYVQTGVKPQSSLQPALHHDKSFNCSYDFNLYQPFASSASASDSLHSRVPCAPQRIMFPLVSTLPRPVPKSRTQAQLDECIHPWLLQKTSTPTTRSYFSSPSSSSTFTNRAVRSLNFIEEAMSKGGYLYNYGKVSGNHSADILKCNLGYKNRFYINSSSSFLSDLSKFAKKSANSPSNYSSNTTKETQHDYSNFKPRISFSGSDILKFHKHPIISEFSKTFNSNNSPRLTCYVPPCSFDSLHNSISKQSAATSGNIHVLDKHNVYNFNTLTMSPMFEKMDGRTDTASKAVGDEKMGARFNNSLDYLSSRAKTAALNTSYNNAPGSSHLLSEQYALKNVVHSI